MMSSEHKNSQDDEADIAAKSPCLCGNLRRAGRLITKVYDIHFQSIGIKVTQYTMLLIIQRLGPVTITALADEAVLDRTTCTRNLKILATKELICFQQGQDKRMKQVALTDLGAEKIKEALPLWQEAQKYCFREIGADASLVLLKELTQMVALLRPG